MPGKVPVRLRDELVAALDSVINWDLPDGAWFQVLEDAAARFIKRKKLCWIRPYDAVTQYLRIKQQQQQQMQDVPGEPNGSDQS